MSFDPITEKIAHFIGSFDMLVEQARMREAYEEFRALRAAEAEAEILDLKSFKGKQSHDLKDFDPGLKLKIPSQPEPVWQNDARNELPPLDVAPQNSQPIAQSPVDQIPLLGGDSGGAIGVNFNYTFSYTFSYTFNLPLPSAVATVTFQKATLYDNDIFGDLSTFGFQSIAQLMPVLEALTNFASSLSLISIDKMSLAADWFSIAAEISDAAAGLDLISNDNVSVAVFQGEAAQSTFVNGIEVESFPEWETILPVYHAEKLALAKELASAEAHARDFEDNAESPLKVEAGHEVVAGANSLINTASITSSWLDAPVFAVAGNVLRFDAISQVNILIEHDFAFSGSLAQDASEAASKTINAATIATRTVEEAKLAASVKKGEAVAPTSTSDPVSAQTTPSNWTVVRHEGDVVQYNWVKQYTFSTDMDQAVLTFSGASTFLGLGENTIANSFTTQQFGFGYDLIIVGGNMIDVNLVSQKNAVLDSDSLSIGRQNPDTVTPEDEMEEVFVLGTSVDGISQAALKPVNLEPEEPSADELAFLDTTSVVAREAASQPFASDDQLPAKSDAEAVGSPGTADVRTIATELEVPREIQGLGPDQEAPEALAQEADQPTSKPAIVPKGATTSDNLLYNQASIERIGVDTDKAISSNFTKAIDDLSNGAENVGSDVAEDELFEGAELLRVLYIDGDFITANALEQTNILGDTDQVHIARDDFAAALQQQIEITTGSNIAANFAAIVDNGKDSTVMAKGNTYSDALIHQANLVDTDVSPNGHVGIAALANEAVAFLAENLIDPALADNIIANTNSMVADTMSQVEGTDSILT